MKKLQYILIIFSLQFVICNLFAQPSITWEKIYDSGYGKDDKSFDICRSADSSNFYIVGDMFIPGTGLRMFAMKINPYGDTLWTKIIGIDSTTSSAALCVAPTPDGGCILSGSWNGAFTLKLNPDGTIGWYKQYNTSFTLWHIEPTSDGGYIACGPSAYILKVNSVGDLLWQRDYFPGYFKDYRWVTEDHSGGYLTLSDSLVIPPNTKNIEITKWDVNGNVEWKRIYPQLGARKDGRILKKITNGYVLFGAAYDSIPGSNITGVIYFSKLDLNYNSSPFKIIRGDRNEIFSSANVINGNRFIFTSRKYTTLIWDTVFTYLRIIDSSGNILHQKNFFIYSQSYSAYILNRITTALNGDLVIGGNVDLPNINNGDDIYALRTDSNLVFPLIGIHQISSEIPAKFTLHQNYPNPFNPQTIIKFEITNSISNENVKLIIYDPLGREIEKLVNEPLNAGIYKISFDGSKFSSGIYFYVLLAGDFKFTRKMVILK